MKIFFNSFYYLLWVKYVILLQNLNGQVLANIIFNGTNLLRVDLKGVMILVPQILQALELILSDLEPKFR